MDRPSCSKRQRVEESDDQMHDSDGSDFDNIVCDYNIDSESDWESDDDIFLQSIARTNFDSESDWESDDDIFLQSIARTNVVPEKWSSEKKQATSIQFSATPGIKIDMSGKDPIDYFHLIADEKFYNYIVDQTNAYAVDILAQTEGDRSRITQWKDITIDDFKLWLGLLFHTGTIRSNRLSDYWKKDYLFNLTVFSQFMSRDRFLLIMRSLHFNCNEEDSSSLGKIQPLIDLFNERMDAIYVPKKNLSIDESLVLWRGRLIIRQYMKGKKAKYGIKLYMLGESGGLALKLIVYGGSADTELGGKDHTKKVVQKLIEGKTGIGHSIFMDNYYNSVPLTEALLQDKTFVTGTLRSNRKGNPDTVVNKKLKTGECISQYTDMGICVTKWKDRREVVTISSEFDGDITNTSNRFGKLCKKPKMVIEYNRYMSGIDYHDQMLAYYPCQRKTIRWYKKLGIHLLQTILLNAHYLYNSENPKISLYDFRLSVIRKLLGPPPLTLPKQPKTKIHLPSFCEKDSAGNTKRRRCKHCWNTTKQRKVSLFHCPDCPNKPGLCLEPCFRLYHEQI
jgi:hypothetical protein